MMKRTLISMLFLALLLGSPGAGLRGAEGSKKILPKEKRQEWLAIGQQLLNRNDPGMAAKLAKLEDPFQLYVKPEPVKTVKEEKPKPIPESKPTVIKHEPLPDNVVLRLIADQKFRKANSMIPPPPQKPRLVTEAGNFKLGQSFSVEIRGIKYPITISDITISSYTLKLNETVLTINYK